MKNIGVNSMWNSFLSLTMEAEGFLLFGRTNEIIVNQMANQSKLDFRGFIHLSELWLQP